MSGKIISLEGYRREHKKAYLKRNETRLNRFVKKFVGSYLITSYSLIAETYLSQCTSNYQQAWDYQDLRDIIVDAIDTEFGAELWRQVQNQFWFDTKFLNRDELVEMCFSCYIMYQTEVAAN